MSTGQPVRPWYACTGDPCTCPKPIEAWREKNATPILRVIGAVMEERRRQDEKWGEQNHPDGTGPDVVWSFTGPAAFVRGAARGECQRLAEEGHVTWRDILLEEIAEAFAEEDENELRTELVQVAAVCVQWAQAIDRRGGPEAASDRALAKLREALSDDSRLAHDIRDGRLPLRQPGNPMGSTDAMGQP